MRQPPSNIQSGQPTAESTLDTPRKVAGADEPEGTHFEPDPEQGVKVVHQVRPTMLPVEGPTDDDGQGGREDATCADVRVTPTVASVREALPTDGDDEGREDNDGEGRPA